MGMLTEAIKEKLERVFTPSQLEVEDQSHLHAGHGGAAEHAASFPDMERAPETHIHVIIESEAFVGMNTLAKHRAVIEVLSDEVAKLHAFSLEAKVKSSQPQ